MFSVDEIKGVDDIYHRPGHQGYRPVGPWPNTRYPPSPQPGTPSVPKHGRLGKPMPPVFGTSCPLRGVSGAIRKWAYTFPDHQARHWLLLIFADRVEATGPRLRRLATYGAPLFLAGFGALWLGKRGAFGRAPSAGRAFVQRLPAARAIG